MTQPWHDLPNAAHIDRIVTEVRARPDAWVAAYKAAWQAMAGDAWDEVWDAAYDAAWHAMGGAATAVAWTVCAEARGLVWDAAGDAITALIAWDDSAYLLAADPEQVYLLATLGHQPAILLYPACVALSKSSTKSTTYST